MEANAASKQLTFNEYRSKPFKREIPVKSRVQIIAVFPTIVWRKVSAFASAKADEATRFAQMGAQIRRYVISTIEN